MTASKPLHSSSAKQAVPTPCDRRRRRRYRRLRSCLRIYGGTFAAKASITGIRCARRPRSPRGRDWTWHFSNASTTSSHEDFRTAKRDSQQVRVALTCDYGPNGQSLLVLCTIASDNTGLQLRLRNTDEEYLRIVSCYVLSDKPTVGRAIFTSSVAA